MLLEKEPRKVYKLDKLPIVATTDQYMLHERSENMVSYEECHCSDMPRGKWDTVLNDTRMMMMATMATTTTTTIMLIRLRLVAVAADSDAVDVGVDVESVEEGRNEFLPW